MLARFDNPGPVVTTFMGADEIAVARQQFLQQVQAGKIFTYR
jgi:hypothetical protein